MTFAGDFFNAAGLLCFGIGARGGGLQEKEGAAILKNRSGTDKNEIEESGEAGSIEGFGRKTERKIRR